MTEDPGATLYAILRDTHEPWGELVEPGFRAEKEYHVVGKGGVLAFHGAYLLAGWLPEHDPAACMRDALRVLADRLRTHGEIRMMVFWRNFRCIKAVRKIGAEPLGVDPDCYFHYRLTPEAYRHG